MFSIDRMSPPDSNFGGIEEFDVDLFLPSQDIAGGNEVWA